MLVIFSMFVMCPLGLKVLVFGFSFCYVAEYLGLFIVC